MYHWKAVDRNIFKSKTEAPESDQGTICLKYTITKRCLQQLRRFGLRVLRRCNTLTHCYLPNTTT